MRVVHISTLIQTSLLFASETSHFILSVPPPSNKVYFTTPWHSLKGCSPLESRLREGGGSVLDKGLSMLSTQSLGISGTKAVLWLRCSSAWTEQNRGLTSVLMTNGECHT